MTLIDPPHPTRTLLSLPRILFGALLILGCVLFARDGVAQAVESTAATGAWELVWSDEFAGPNGALPDPARWVFDVGGSGNGNHESESYTARPANVQQRDGHLVITAVNEEFTGADGIARHYTSGRIKTEGRFAQAYGRFEARIQLPLGKGIWPAFWMLGSDIGTAGWPGCGEIDIFENIGEARTSYSTLHGPGYSGGSAISTKVTVPGAAVDQGFHVYAVEWVPGAIRFLLDERLVAERTPADLPAGAKWVFDHPFFLILNVAVGGAWPGNPDETTVFPQRMLVDYVRVYKAALPRVKAAESGR